MVINCSHCDTTVDGIELGKHEILDENIPVYRKTLLSCPLCGEALLAGQELIYIPTNEMVWSGAIRLWPEKETYLSAIVPSIVQTSLDEANKCYKGKAYLACAVMCRRAVEAICIDKGIEKRNMVYGLRELLDKQVIDKRIFEWAEALRLHGNKGAHASDEKISKEDARDLLDFLLAICEYVYILTEKFNSFIDRKATSL